MKPLQKGHDKRHYLCSENSP